MFSLKEMTLGKITIDNSVKYIPSTKNSTLENSHDHKSKTASNPRKQNNNFLQNIKKSYYRVNSSRRIWKT